ncbi:MAG TPA: glycogen synthase, partial [Microlunatus sp.]|nr:glycogen synthase [Microlunatus sp.]
KINSLTRDRDRAVAFGKAGRQRCIDEFSWAKIAAETVDVYRAAIAAHAG